VHNFYTPALTSRRCSAAAPTTTTKVQTDSSQRSCDYLSRRMVSHALKPFIIHRSYLSRIRHMLGVRSYAIYIFVRIKKPSRRIGHLGTGKLVEKCPAAKRPDKTTESEKTVRSCVRVRVCVCVCVSLSLSLSHSTSILCFSISGLRVSEYVF